MATYTSVIGFDQYDRSAWLATFGGAPDVHNWTYQGGQSDSSHLVYLDTSDSTVTVFYGTGMSVGGTGFRSWTTLTSVVHYEADGTTVLERLDNFTQDISDAHGDGGHPESLLLQDDDTITGSSGDDLMTGGGGDNVFYGGAGKDDLRGANGANDTFVYKAATEFAAGEAISGGGGDTDTIQLQNAGNIDFTIGAVAGIEALQYFSGTSTATIADLPDMGLTTIIGSSGADALIIDPGMRGNDNSVLTFENWTAGQDTITINGPGVGTSQNDTFVLPTDAGRGGANVQAGGGDDIIIMNSETGSLPIDGGSGTNTLLLRNITVDESGGLTNVQHLVYDSGNSSITLSGADFAAGNLSTITGSDGTDTLIGNAKDGSVDLSQVTFTNWTDGVDSITISALTAISEDRVMTGSSQADVIIGGAGNDTLNGGGGDDTLTGGQGNNTLDGGTGSNTASYAYLLNNFGLGPSNTPVTVDLSISGPQNTGVGIDTLINVQNLTGSDGDDTLSGDANANVLNGGDGNDRLNGAAGGDTLVGGAGDDTLIGGADADSFLFQPNSGHDLISDPQLGTGAGDVVSFDNTKFSSFAEVQHAVSWTGNGLMINEGDGNTVTLRGADIFNIASDDFAFTNAQAGTNPIEGVSSAAGHTFGGHFAADGESDVLWRDGNGQLYTSSLVSGTHTSQTPTAIGGPLGNYEVAGTSDLNHDGRSDIVLFDPHSGTVATWLMNGTSFSGSHIGVAAGYEVVGTGDFDGNGFGDILLRSQSGQLAAWEFHSGLGFSGLHIGPTLAANYSVVGTGDFNGDHHTDLLLRTDAGQIAIWNIGSGGSVGGLNLGSAVPNNQVVGVGDINGDGTDDIVFNTPTGQAIGWEMHPGFGFTPGNIGAPVSPASFTLAGVGDTNADGKADLIFRGVQADGGGQEAIWQLNGFTPAATFTSDADHHVGWLFA